MRDLISRQAAIDTVDEMPVMKDNNGIEFIEKSLVKTRIGLLPSAQSQYEEITPEEAASEIASGSMMSAWYRPDWCPLVTGQNGGNNEQQK